MATEWRSEGFVGELQDLVLRHEEVHDFLQDLVGLSAGALALDGVIGCSVTLRHLDATFTVAFSAPDIGVMDEVQYEVREGPGLEAINTGSTVLVDDMRSEDRWVEYGQRVRNFDIGAIMAVPMGVGPDGGAVLNFYARAPHVFARVSNAWPRRSPLTLRAPWK
ncbi:GAF domain-containing protein [Arthrobacter sp. NamB2]|uniref:GAF domain-containing protein n=1 Tax=Arthrobacter sp. NamB2 TaxID=2576035 RepID=UPI0010CA1F29|nr:GAF domain-containing protein [Arthrobacter sp. NamB2]TKV26141.1 GAF domain-containing protein [Arthrobacter sp. NamB2]